MKDNKIIEALNCCQDAIIIRYLPHEGNEPIDIHIREISALLNKQQEIIEQKDKLLETIRADTVRKMQTMFEMRFGTYTDKDMTPITEVFRRLDKIAKEMLEGNNG